MRVVAIGVGAPTAVAASCGLRVHHLVITSDDGGGSLTLGVLVEPGVVESRLWRAEGTAPADRLEAALHVVVVIDDLRREERLVTVYEPDAGMWTSDYRRRH
jgi:hypothetical protein